MLSGDNILQAGESGDILDASQLDLGTVMVEQMLHPEHIEVNVVGSVEYARAGAQPKEELLDVYERKRLTN